MKDWCLTTAETVGGMIAFVFYMAIWVTFLLVLVLTGWAMMKFEGALIGFCLWVLGAVIVWLWKKDWLPKVSAVIGTISLYWVVREWGPTARWLIRTLGPVNLNVLILAVGLLAWVFGKNVILGTKDGDGGTDSAWTLRKVGTILSLVGVLLNVWTIADHRANYDPTSQEMKATVMLAPVEFDENGNAILYERVTGLLADSRAVRVPSNGQLLQNPVGKEEEVPVATIMAGIQDYHKSAPVVLWNSASVLTHLDREQRSQAGLMLFIILAVLCWGVTLNKIGKHGGVMRFVAFFPAVWLTWGLYGLTKLGG